MNDFLEMIRPIDIIVFDLDDTLMKPTPTIDKLTMYLEINHQRWIPEAKKIFERCLLTNEVHILTNRHPILTDEIAMKLGIDPKFVHCRNYALSTMQMKKVMHNPHYEQKFLDYMAVEKTAFLNTLQGTVRYVDDMAHRFDLDKLHNNIWVYDQQFQFVGSGGYDFANRGGVVR